MNLEGYANLENWVADLDRRIEAILLARLQHVITLWCAEFERSDEDSSNRREPPTLREITNKRRDKRKDEKVRVCYWYCSGLSPNAIVVAYRRRACAQAHRPRDQDTEPGHLLGPTDRARSANLDQTAA